MGKKEKHRQDLVDLLEEFIETGDAVRLTAYIVSNSNLPGRRANLELAGAFGDLVKDGPQQAQQRLWDLCVNMTEISADEAPVNAPREFIPFCGAIGVGTLGSASSRFFDRALTTLQALAHDPRWRMREAVRFGLQRLLAKWSRDTLATLKGWVADGDLLEMRAAAVTVAEPTMLKEGETALAALQLHREIFDRLLTVRERKSEDFRILRRALGYTVSVVVCAVPQEGFTFMAQLVDSQDTDVLWIVRENLKKNRLVKSFPDQVRSVKVLLE